MIKRGSVLAWLISKGHKLPLDQIWDYMLICPMSADDTAEIKFRYKVSELDPWTEIVEKLN